MDTLTWLQRWYSAQCNGEWERAYRVSIKSVAHFWKRSWRRLTGLLRGRGISIGTLDNPGWSISINLRGTRLEARSFQDIESDRSEDDWVFCRVRKGIFEGAGGPMNLGEIIEAFRAWAE